METTTMQSTQLHEDKFFKIVWDESTRIISIDWKEATSSMTDEEFKAQPMLFAGHVEQKKARGILDVSRFRHKPGPDIEEWRVKNIRAVTTLPACDDSRSCFPRAFRFRP